MKRQEEAYNEQKNELRDKVKQLDELYSAIRGRIQDDYRSSLKSRVTPTMIEAANSHTMAEIDNLAKQLEG